MHTHAAGIRKRDVELVVVDARTGRKSINVLDRQRVKLAVGFYDVKTLAARVRDQNVLVLVSSTQNRTRQLADSSTWLAVLFQKFTCSVIVLLNDVTVIASYEYVV